jgi:hypothetical protein
LKFLWSLVLGGWKFAQNCAKDFAPAVVFLYKANTSTSQFMKKILCLAASLLALNLTPAFGQPTPGSPVTQPSYTPPPPAARFQQRLQSIIRNADGSPQAGVPPLTKFNLDFPGGTPKELVAAIEKATGKPLNAIIPDEAAATKLPPLKMNNVDVPQLFSAVVNMSYKYAPSRGNFVGGSNTGRDVTSSYGFETRDSQSGQLSDDTIWYFFVYKASTPQPRPPVEKICRFYSLETPLDRGFMVDDITTAIQTGWKMSGIAVPPELNYHKETKLLIVFGEPGELDTIESVLHTLPSSKATRVQEDNMEKVVNQLKMDVAELKKKVSAPALPTASAPEEKSGK